MEGCLFRKLYEAENWQGDQNRVVVHVSYCLIVGSSKDIFFFLTTHCLELNLGASSSELCDFGQVT